MLSSTVPRRTPTTKPRHVSPRMSLNPKPYPLTTITKLLWGQSLPSYLLIAAVRTIWSASWHLMMYQIAPSDPTGLYSRPASQFHSPQSPLSRQKPGTLHLYVDLPCHRALKGLEDAVPVSIASMGSDGSWKFRYGDDISDGDRAIPIPGSDHANGCKTLREVYNFRRGGYNGRSTVPMLWDVERKEVVCNESHDIIELFNSGLNRRANNPGYYLSPPELRKKIEDWNRVMSTMVPIGNMLIGLKWY